MNWTNFLLVGALTSGIVVGQTNPNNPPLILGNIDRIISGVISIVGSAGNTGNEAVDVNMTVVTTVVEKAITQIGNETGKLAGTVIGPTGSQLANKVSTNMNEAVQSLANAMGGLFRRVQSQRNFDDLSPTESGRVELLEALNIFQNLFNRMTLENISPLMDRYKEWSTSGLIPGIATLLIEPRQKLVKAIGRPISVLCGVKNDTSGKLTTAQPNAILALNSVRSTAQSVVDDCEGLSCLLLVPVAQQVVRDCNC